MLLIFPTTSLWSGLGWDKMSGPKLPSHLLCPKVWLQITVSCWFAWCFNHQTKRIPLKLLPGMSNHIEVPGRQFFIYLKSVSFLTKDLGKRWFFGQVEESYLGCWLCLLEKRLLKKGCPSHLSILSICPLPPIISFLSYKFNQAVIYYSNQDWRKVVKITL